MASISPFLVWDWKCHCGHCRMGLISNVLLKNSHFSFSFATVSVSPSFFTKDSWKVYSAASVLMNVCHTGFSAVSRNFAFFSLTKLLNNLRIKYFSEIGPAGFVLGSGVETTLSLTILTSAINVVRIHTTHILLVSLLHTYIYRDFLSL